MKKQKISIIISTKNEENNIGRCLQSIKSQTYGNYEIILVDYNSTDRTIKIAKNWTSNIISLEDNVNLKEIKNFRGAQLNLGVKSSKGEIIFFPDADMTFDKGLLEDAANRMNRADALYVPEVIVGDGFFGRVRNFERSFCNGSSVDAVRFVMKDLYAEVGGFDEKNIMFGPDDWDFSQRIKQKTNKIELTNNRIYHHEEMMTIKSYINKKKKYFNTLNGYIHKWGKFHPEIQNQLNPKSRIKIFLEEGNFLRLLRHPLLSLGMFYVNLRVGLNYLYYQSK